MYIVVSLRVCTMTKGCYQICFRNTCSSNIVPSTLLKHYVTMLTLSLSLKNIDK